VEKASVSVDGDDPGGAIAPAVNLGLPPITAPGYGKNATPMATLGSGNVPSALARRLAAAHADKDAHDAMSGASGGVIAFWPRARPSGSGLRHIDYCDVSRRQRRSSIGCECPDRTGTLAQFLNRSVSEWAARSGIK
jgi:hypothetical protein